MTSLKNTNKMVVEFSEPAFIELDDAIEYYNIQSQGLGKVFFDEALTVIKLISQFPIALPAFSANTKKAILKKFPYSLIFVIHENKVNIIAVAHHHRSPEYWIDRIT